MLKMKKFLASILALAMVLGMTLAVSADEIVTVPDETDKATVTVSNVEAIFEEGESGEENIVEVTAYQIVKAHYNESGFVKYVKANDVLVIDDVNAPTSDEVATIVENGVTGLESEGLTTAATEDGLAAYTANLAPGYWIVLVNGGVKIYNPMLVGVYYSESGSVKTMLTGNVDATTNWTLETENAWAKSALPTVDKSIVNNDGNNNGSGVAAGDTVEFRIDTVIPSYSKAYEEVIVTVTDELSAGLTLKQDSIEITIGGDEFTPATDKLTTTANGFVLNLSDVALDNNGETVVITYKAIVNEAYGYNFDANTNTATLTYTNNPTDYNEKHEIKDKTYTYTFGINANLFGSSTEEWNKVTEELIKGQLVKREENGEIKEVFEPLANAEFTLTRADGKEYKAISDDKGMLKYTGLDAGTYTLVETKAPAGFAINEEEHTVVITAEYNTDGTLNYYTIVIDGEATSTYTATYEGTGTSVTVEEIVDSQETTEILNTKLIALPGTGGMGTTIFTVVGCVVMIGAAFLFMMNRKKESK